MDSIREIEAQCKSDSTEWFGEELSQNLTYMTVCLAGEVGEFANLVKKCVRGTLDANDPEIQMLMAYEMTDVFIYLCNIAMICNVDLGVAYDSKREINAERFGGVAEEAPGGVLRDVSTPNGEGEGV